MRKQYWQIS